MPPTIAPMIAANSDAPMPMMSDRRAPLMTIVSTSRWRRAVVPNGCSSEGGQP